MPFTGLATCAIMDYEVLDCRRAGVLDFAAQILAQGGEVRIRARGSSMYPCIRHGDAIEVEPVEVSAVTVGDVVLYRDENDRLVGHRVVKMGGEDLQGTLVTKGDWTPRADPPIYAGQVLGRVVAIERGGRRTELNTGRKRLIQVLWGRMSPHSHWLYLPVKKGVRAVRRVMNKVRRSVS